MKKIILILILAAVLAPVFSQENERGRTDLYYVNVPIEKIYPSNVGYIIMYRSASQGIQAIGVPNEWLQDSAGRAEIMILPPGRNWPTMSVFYRNGEFSHVRIYVHKSKRHATWGLINGYPDLSGFFEDAESFRLVF